MVDATLLKVAAALAGAYLFTRPRPPASPPANSGQGLTTSGPPGHAPGGSDGPGFATIWKDARGIVIPAAAAIGVGAGVATVAAAEAAAGAYVGYKIDGVAGAIAGGANPSGVVAAAGGRIIHDGVQALGGNEAAQDAGRVSGYVLGALVGVGELAAAAALLPTVGIVVGVAELVGQLLGHGDPNPPPPTPQQQVDALFYIATHDHAAWRPVPDADRVTAAAQLVSWANGPAVIPAVDGGPFLSLPSHPNPFRLPARERVGQLGPGAEQLLN